MQTVFVGQCVGLTSIQHITIGRNPCRITLRESNISLQGDAPTLLLEREQASCCSGGCLYPLAMKSTLPYDCCSQLSQTKHGNWVYELRERLWIRLSATAIYTSIRTNYNLHSTNTDLSASSDIEESYSPHIGHGYHAIKQLIMLILVWIYMCSCATLLYTCTYDKCLRLKVSWRMVYASSNLFCNPTGTVPARFCCKISEIQKLQPEVPQCKQANSHNGKHHKIALGRETCILLKSYIL